MELREHAATVMSTLDQSINLLSDYDNFVTYLHSIGKLHRKVPDFKREHFWVSQLWTVVLSYSVPSHNVNLNAATRHEGLNEILARGKGATAAEPSLFVFIFVSVLCLRLFGSLGTSRDTSGAKNS